MQQHQVPAYNKLVDLTVDLLDLDSGLDNPALDDALFDRIYRAYADLSQRANDLMKLAGVTGLPWDHAHERSIQRMHERKRLIAIRKAHAKIA